MATTVENDREIGHPDEIDDYAFERFATPFDAEEILERTDDDGEVLRYIRVSSVRRRLNDVIGPSNWETDIQLIGHACVCKLKIKLPSGRSLVRTGVGHVRPGPADDIAIKGAATDALKRAAVEFGIGAHLYEPDAEEYRPRERDRDRDRDRDDRRDAQRDNARSYDRGGDRNGNRGRWGGGQQQRNGDNGRSNGDRGGYRGPSNGRRQESRGGSSNGTPRTGKQLWGWLKDLEEKEGYEGLVAHMISWGKRNRLASKMSDWGDQVVDDAVAEAESFCGM